MSELKATTIYDAYWKANSVGEGTGILVYLKSEADKVIANRDYEIKNLKDSIGKLLRADTEQIITEVMQKALIYGEGFVRVEDMMTLIIELRRQKYKRCLDKAKRCEEKCRDLENAVVRCSTYPYMSTCPTDCDPRYTFFKRWHIRWQELAEKFKETK